MLLMKSVIRWAINSAPGMNVIMLGLMAVGAASLWTMRREVFPEFELEVVMVTVPYPGSTPEDVESGICQKIEESVRSIDGIKQVTSIAQEGAGYVLMELRADVPDVQKVLNEISREVERIPSFPELAEDPSVQQITFRDAAIRVALIGPESDRPDREIRLREVAEGVRDAILQLPSVSSASIMGARNYQIDVELSEDTLREYGLSLERVASILRSRNVELPGGQLKGEGTEILLRAKNKGKVGDEIRRLPIVTQPGGAILTVGDLGTVRDEFEDSSSLSEVNGQPAMVISVERTKTEDLLAMVDAVREFTDGEGKALLPEGYRFELWGDTSTDVRDRLELLTKNGLGGLLLVFLVLALFLEIRLAYWVALGIPISILGAGVVLGWGGQTLNMLSLFSFLMALGIVVDDAIVIGENIYAHRELGKDRMRAAVDGAAEVLPSVIASVATTIIAFSPMFFVSGVMGKFMAVIPFAVIAMLVISLLESTFVLPCHLAHPHEGMFKVLGFLSYPIRPLGILLSWSSDKATRGMDAFAERIYAPALRFSLHYPAVPLAIGVAMFVFTIGLVRGGVVTTVLFPKTDANNVRATVTFPDGTPMAVTDLATQRMDEAIRNVSLRVAEDRAKKEGIPIDEIFGADESGMTGPVKLTFRQVGEISSMGGPAAGAGGSGSHVGQIFVELHDTTVRTTSSEKLLQMWRDEVGKITGAESVTYGSVDVGPGGKPIEFKLLAPADKTDQLEAATELTKAKLAEFDGVFDISDDNAPGKWEFQFKVKDGALATGITPTDLGQTVRNAYYGAEVMRLQRGRHEVKLMVRYPEDERRSLADFKEIRVRTMDGGERPITELADVQVRRGFSEINRIDQKRSITLTADLDETKTNADSIVSRLKADFIPELKAQFPAITVKWEGQQEQSRESVGSLLVGFVVALLMMFVLLVLQFRSYVQPLIIMFIIPFGMIGAVWGHALLGLPLTLFSMFGLVALSGVVINDSIVLIDFINHRVREGLPVRIALAEAGRRRFRPVMLTSMTTIAGLLPLLAERSFQAQLLIPMAASLAFGLMLATGLVLFLVPVFYQIYVHICEVFGSTPVDTEILEATEHFLPAIPPVVAKQYEGELVHGG
jgi:hydrophobic/amphiphilic exporter-1 (mainly G- bacteria), HAE1 family